MAGQQDVIRKYLNPELINKIAQLELNAKRIIEGYLSGSQKSHLKGFSVEFASHREYTQGDDIRRIDWKVFGRTDKLYIKEYELETNVNAFIALDISKSMMYGSAEYTKFEYACFLASALSYLLLNQHDSVGFALFDKDIRKVVPSLTGQGQIAPIIGTMEGAEIEEKTDLSSVFSQIAGLLKRKSFVVLISDFFEDIDHVKKGLDYLVGKKNELLILNVMDQRELDFNFRDLTMFEGLEDNYKRLCDPPSIRRAYVECVNEFMKELKTISFAMRSDYWLFSTHQPLETALTEFLISRLEQRKR
ncbi:MAG: DUF58 domain-containing protein [Planctomycetes bacterium]|nr:DUF58 domain-containing protein [Planctomycetota bacterium]